MRDKTQSLDAILDNFQFADAAKEGKARAGTTLTIWVPVATKERYDRIQQKSRRKFSSKLRELIEVAIIRAEASEA